MSWICQQTKRMAATAAMRVCLLMAFAAAMQPGIHTHAEFAEWTTPGIDTWFYKHYSSGQSTYLPTWGNLSTDSSGHFLPADQEIGAARHSQALLAFQPSAGLPALPAANTYEITSVTVTMKLYTSQGTQQIRYWNEPLTIASAEQKIANHSVAWPIELFGVGMRLGYDHFEFGTNTPGGPGLEENVFAYPTPLPPAQPDWYVAYPIVGDTSQSGVYHDVSNNLTGGFSATAAGFNTSAFDADPWAIGTTNLTHNAANPPIVPDGSEFTFSLDLNKPGVREYIEQSLADGGLGFFVSSMHQTEEGGGGGAYPYWYSAESPFAGAVPPKLRIEYQLAPACGPGDYDCSGDVGPEDFDLWSETFGESVTPGEDADGNNDGKINTADYVIWRMHSSGSGAGSSAVPEPASGMMLAFGLLGVGGLMRHRSRQPVQRGFRPVEPWQQRN